MEFEVPVINGSGLNASIGTYVKKGKKIPQRIYFSRMFTDIIKGSNGIAFSISEGEVSMVLVTGESKIPSYKITGSKTQAVVSNNDLAGNIAKMLSINLLESDDVSYRLNVEKTEDYQEMKTFKLTYKKQ